MPTLVMCERIEVALPALHIILRKSGTNHSYKNTKAGHLVIIIAGHEAE